MHATTLLKMFSVSAVHSEDVRCSMLDLVRFLSLQTKTPHHPGQICHPNCVPSTKTPFPPTKSSLLLFPRHHVPIRLGSVLVLLAVHLTPARTLVETPQASRCKPLGPLPWQPVCSVLFAVFAAHLPQPHRELACLGFERLQWLL